AGDGTTPPPARTSLGEALSGIRHGNGRVFAFPWPGRGPRRRARVRHPSATRSRGARYEHDPEEQQASRAQEGRTNSREESGSQEAGRPQEGCSGQGSPKDRTQEG